MTRLNSNMLTSRKETGKKIILPLVPHTVKVIKKTDWEGQKEARTGNKIAPASKPGVVPTTYLSQIHCCVNQSKENHRTLHRICFPEKVGTMLQKAIKEDSLSLLKFSILKNRVLVMWTPCLVVGQRLLRPDWNQKEQLFLVFHCYVINCGEVWRITPASVRWGGLEGKVDPRDRTQIYQLTGHQISAS